MECCYTKSPPSIGKTGEELLRKVRSDDIVPFFREIGYDGAQQVELILILGENAIEPFCEDYETYLEPNREQIPEGKICLYAVACGEIEYIRQEDEQKPPSIPHGDIRWLDNVIDTRPPRGRKRRL